MKQKGKYPPEEKEKIVKQYLEGKYNLNEICKNYSVAEETFREWLRLYRTHGIYGITPKSTSKIYSQELKIAAVTDYLSGRFTQDEICIKYDITKTKLLRKWIRKYNGHENFKSSLNGRINNMIKGRKTSLDEKIEIITYCIENGKNYAATIEKYNVSYDQIYKWVKKYNENGIDGLADRRGKTKDKDSMTDLEKLKAENRILQAQLKDKEIENELLKKVMEIGRRRY